MSTSSKKITSGEKIKDIATTTSLLFKNNHNFLSRKTCILINFMFLATISNCIRSSNNLSNLSTSFTRSSKNKRLFLDQTRRIMTAADIKRSMIESGTAPLAQKKEYKQIVNIPALESANEPAKSVELIDEYNWLRGKKWPNETVDEPEIVKYLESENEYCKDFFS